MLTQKNGMSFPKPSRKMDVETNMVQYQGNIIFHAMPLVVDEIQG